MYLTLIGVVLGALISWVITHAYYKISSQKSDKSNPIPLLKGLSNEIRLIRESLGKPQEKEIQSRSLKRMEEYVKYLRHIFITNITVLLHNIEHLIYLNERNDHIEVQDQIKRLKKSADEIKEDLRNDKIANGFEEINSVDDVENSMETEHQHSQGRS